MLVFAADYVENKFLFVRNHLLQGLTTLNNCK